MTLVYAVSALPHDTILPEEDFLEEHPMKHYNDESNTKTDNYSNTKTDNYSNAARNAEDSISQSELAQLRQLIKVKTDIENRFRGGPPSTDLVGVTNVGTCTDQQSSHGITCNTWADWGLDLKTVVCQLDGGTTCGCACEGGAVKKKPCEDTNTHKYACPYFKNSGQCQYRKQECQKTCYNKLKKLGNAPFCSLASTVNNAKCSAYTCATKSIRKTNADECANSAKDAASCQASCCESSCQGFKCNGDAGHGKYKCKATPSSIRCGSGCKKHQCCTTTSVHDHFGNAKYAHHLGGTCN